MSNYICSIKTIVNSEIIFAVIGRHGCLEPKTTAVEIQIEDKSNPEGPTVKRPKENDRRYADSLPRLIYY